MDRGPRSARPQPEGRHVPRAFRAPPGHRRRQWIRQEYAGAPRLLSGAPPGARSRGRRARRAPFDPPPLRGCEGDRGNDARSSRSIRSPIGRTPRSASRPRSSASGTRSGNSSRRLPEARGARLRAPARFSFNTANGGRCVACEGQGAIVSEMAFLPDVVSPCEACGGARFEPATLDVRYAGLSIGDVLRLTARRSREGLRGAQTDRPSSPRRSADLGVGYVGIGQGSNTLSGGEAQRAGRLSPPSSPRAAHTSPRSTCSTNPPRACTSPDAVRRLIQIMGSTRRARGDTLVVIEHHPDVIRSADWVVELGPRRRGRRRARSCFEGTSVAAREAAKDRDRALPGRATGRGLGRAADLDEGA